MSKIPDDVVENAVNAYGKCGAGFHESFRAAGDVFVEWALEEAAKRIEMSLPDSNEDFASGKRWAARAIRTLMTD
jgi:hypothetical protein